MANFHVAGYCTRDADPNVQCCLSKECVNADKSSTGKCINKSGGTCSGIFAQGQCPGPTDVQCCLSRSSQKLDVVFWFNAFIPLEIDDVTRPWIGNPGKTVIEVPLTPDWVPWYGRCYTTDQRSFNNSKYASARMHSEARIAMDPSLTAGSDFVLSQQNFCGKTTAVACSSGKLQDTKTATMAGRFHVKSSSADYAVIDYKFQASDPLVPVAARINFEGTLKVIRQSHIEVTGKVDDFPAFEAYVVINGGTSLKLVQLGPKPGAGLMSLFGGATRNVYGRIDM